MSKLYSLKNTIIAVAIVALLVAVATAGAASYAMIKPGSVNHTKLSEGLNNERASTAKRLTALETHTTTNGVNGAQGPAGPRGLKGDTGATGAKGETGATGAKGDTGDAVMAGSYYSIAYYDVGDTNGGAIATAGCVSKHDTAISGGTSTDDYTKTVAIGQSFPGRMDWDGPDNVSNNTDDNQPYPDRLDGWVVQFASETGKAPERVKVWALCVPDLGTQTVTTYTESD